VRNLSAAASKRIKSYTDLRKSLTNIPEGWHFPCYTIFESRAEAVAYSKNPSPSSADDLCPVCRSRLLKEELKVVKRGGTSDPHWIVLCRPFESTSK